MERGGRVVAVVHGSMTIEGRTPPYRLRPFPLSAPPWPAVAAASGDAVTAVLAAWRDGVVRHEPAVMLLHGGARETRRSLVDRFARDSAAVGWTVAVAELGRDGAAPSVPPGRTGSFLVTVPEDEAWSTDLRCRLLTDPVLRAPERLCVLLTAEDTTWWPALRGRLRKARLPEAATYRIR